MFPLKVFSAGGDYSLQVFLFGISQQRFFYSCGRRNRFISPAAAYSRSSSESRCRIISHQFATASSSGSHCSSRREMGGWAAVCQMTSTNNVQANIEQAEGLIKGAAGKGADMIFLPEAFDFIGSSSEETATLAQPLKGQTIGKFQEMAIENKVWLSLGGFHQKEAADTKIWNTHVIIDKEGKIVQTYNKTHLFDAEIPGKFRLKESDYVNPGASLVSPVASPLGNIGLGICYDVRFPEMSLSLRNAGAEVLTFPSAFTVNTGMAHWKSLLKSRAIETQCYVIAAAQTGQHNAKRSSYGHAMIVDPWGTVLAECREGISFALAEIDLDYLKKVRCNMPVEFHRRPELYGLQPILSTNMPTDDWVFQFGPTAKVFGSSVVCKSGLSVLFVNKKPVVPGHILVSPLRSVKSMTDLTQSEMTDLFCLVQKAEKFLMKQFDTTSCTITVQDGHDAGQTIEHLHVHVMPRKPGDFKDNDDIYRELETHDKDPDAVGWRNQEAMTAEAAKFRSTWKTMF